jgi:hypothetical protein
MPRPREPEGAWPKDWHAGPARVVSSYGNDVQGRTVQNLTTRDECTVYVAWLNTGFFKTRLNTRVSTGTVARSVNYCYVPVRFGFNRGCLCLEPGLMLRLPFRSRTMRITGTSKTKTGTRRHHSPPVPLCLAGMGGRVLVLPPKLECTFFFTPNKN